MEIHEITVVIDKKGQVHLYVAGVKGAACLELTEELEKTLGGAVVHRDFTAEYQEGSQPRHRTKLTH